MMLTTKFLANYSMRPLIHIASTGSIPCFAVHHAPNENACVRALQLNPECGYLGGYEYSSANPSMFLQYWRSFDHLVAYARYAHAW